MNRKEARNKCTCIQFWLCVILNITGLNREGNVTILYKSSYIVDLLHFRSAYWTWLRQYIAEEGGGGSKWIGVDAWLSAFCCLGPALQRVHSQSIPRWTQPDPGQWSALDRYQNQSTAALWNPGSPQGQSACNYLTFWPWLQPFTLDCLLFNKAYVAQTCGKCATGQESWRSWLCCSLAEGSLPGC